MTKEVEKLPIGKQITYAVGQLGWSTLVNIIGLQLVYFYIPPEGSGIQVFIPQVVFLAVLNAITLIAAGGRLWDAITDPLIANLSDRWKGKMGRRMPFLLAGSIPAAVFCTLMFVPITKGESGWNIAWLFIMQTFFYLFLTTYVTPFFALLPELGHTANERLNLSTWISITYALGIMFAAQVPLFGNIFGSLLGIENTVLQLQIAIGFLSGISIILMMVPVMTIEEKRYCIATPTDVPLFQALKKTFKNKNFIYYVAADFSYFMALTIVMTGLLYYITVLLGLNKELMSSLLPAMVVISFVFYPVVNILAKKVGKKILISSSFIFMSMIFFFIYFLGRLPLSETIQAWLIVIFYAIPISFLGILPNAVLADIAEHDALKTDVRQEGMFFAARTLMQKFGQTFGVLIFAALTSLGKDPGDDFGVRLSGMIGFALCVFAGLYFMKYKEKKLLKEIDEMQ